MNRVAEAYNRIAPLYDDDYATGMSRAEDRELSRLLAPYVDSRIVHDLGCGTGLLLDLFPEIKTDKYQGVDISLEMLNRAHEKHPNYYFNHADAWTLEYPANSVVSLYGAPSYVASGIVRRGLKYQLRAGGRFFLMPYAQGRLKTRNGKLVDQHSHLWNIYPAQWWAMMLEDVRSLEIRGFNLLRSPRLLRWEAPLARRFPDRSQYLIITGVM